MRIKLTTRGSITHQDGTQEWVNLEFSGELTLEPGDDNPLELIINRIGALDAKQSRLVHLLRESLAGALGVAMTPNPPPPVIGAGNAST
jgi:hypothetical protein